MEGELRVVMSDAACRWRCKAEEWRPEVTDGRKLCPPFCERVKSVSWSAARESCTSIDLLTTIKKSEFKRDGQPQRKYYMQ